MLVNPPAMQSPYVIEVGRWDTPHFANTNFVEANSVWVPKVRPSTSCRNQLVAHFCIAKPLPAMYRAMPSGLLSGADGPAGH